MTAADSTPSAAAHTETNYQLTGPRPGDKPFDVTAIERDDWEPGQPCPECGATHIGETHLDGEAAIHQNGTTTFNGNLDRQGTIEYWCLDCETVLYRHAAAACWLAITNQLGTPTHDHDENENETETNPEAEDHPTSP